MTEPKQTYQPGDTIPLTLGTGPRGPVTMPFCYIPPCPEGFWMGSRDGYSIEQPVHRVIIPYGFWLGQTPVTQEQFKIWTDSEDYAKRFKDKPHKNHFDGQPDHPAEELTWRQATAFCNWLSELLKCNNPFPSDIELCRLPYEAEWEYACRAGTDTDYHTGDGEAALREAGWFDGNSKSQTRPVGKLAPNLWKLHDMHGNVWEWCADRWEANAYRRRWDGITPEETFLLNERCGDKDDSSAYGENRVRRGGSWVNSAGRCRAAFRIWVRAGFSFRNSGLRACLVPQPDQAVQSSKRASGRTEAGEEGRRSQP